MGGARGKSFALRPVAADQKANRFVPQQRRRFEQDFEALLHSEVPSVDGEELISRKSVALSKFAPRRRGLVILQFDRVRKIDQLGFGHSLAAKRFEHSAR